MYTIPKRITTNFLTLKILLTIFSIAFFIFNLAKVNEVNFGIFLFILFYLIIFTLLIKMIRTQPQIDYDGDSYLIVYKNNNKEIFKIALQDITQLNSVIIFNFNINGIFYKKYNLFYYDDNKALQKISFFEAPYNSEITTIIKKIISINPSFKKDQTDWF